MLIGPELHILKLPNLFKALNATITAAISPMSADARPRLERLRPK